MGKPWIENGVLIGQGGAADPKTTARGTANQVLRVPASGTLEPGFGAVSLTAGVTGVLPRANGGTEQAVGALAIMQFNAVGVLAGGSPFMGHGADVTEANVAFPCPVTAGTILMLAAAASTAPVGAETFTYRIRVALANVGTVVQLTGAAIAGTVAQSTAVTLGQLICVRITASAGAATANHMACLAIRVDG